MPPSETQPRPARRIDVELLVPFMAASFGSPDAKRVGMAVRQYQMALNYWSTRGQPLALGPLYIALEALAPVAQRRQREQLGLQSEQVHATAEESTSPSATGATFSRVGSGEMCCAAATRRPMTPPGKPATDLSTAMGCTTTDWAAWCGSWNSVRSTCRAGLTPPGHAAPRRWCRSLAMVVVHWTRC